jgi:hypothetical protein
MSYAIEHGSSRPGRWLRHQRLKVTLGLAAFEGVLYLVGVLGWWEAAFFALIACGFWWFVGRANRSDVVREVSWILAASQLIVLCVPLALGLVKAVAIAVVALFAVVALIFLFSERR